MSDSEEQTRMDTEEKTLVDAEEKEQVGEEKTQVEAPHETSAPEPTVPSGSLISKLEEELPPNTPENPQPTIFKVTKADVQAHIKYVRSFTKNLTPNALKLPTFTEKKINEAGDDYIWTKTSPKGEQKITQNGFLLGDRKFLVSTFTLPGRGKKLFCVANEAAKALNYRDAFLLCTRAKQLYKMPTNDAERQYLEEASLIPKIRNRVHGVISMKAIYMTFGPRCVLVGKRVEDDYWEEAAIEQGYTPAEQVFPVDKNYGPRAASHRKKDSANKIEKTMTRQMMVHPIPSLEDRREYLLNTSRGEVAQVLPGQGIAGGVELAAVSSIPRYRNEPGVPMKSDSKQTNNRALNLILDNKNTTPAVATSGGINTLPINNDLVGEKSRIGLPYYKPDVIKRVILEDSERLKEIEYLHSTVELNNHVNNARVQRSKQWPYYWQTKAGVQLGLTREDVEDFHGQKEKFLQHEEVETRFNEYLNCEQLMTKRRRPNPNYLGHGNLSGVKPPYAERPLTREQKDHVEAMNAFAAPPSLQQNAEQRFAQHAAYR